MNVESLDSDILNKIKSAYGEIQELRGKPNPEYDQYYVKMKIHI